MTFSEMEEVAESKKGGHLYRQDSAEFVDGEISALVAMQTSELAEATDKLTCISLSDTAAVKSKAAAFMRVCEEHSIIPTMTAFCHALGYSSEGVRRYRIAHPAHPTSVFLELFGEICAGIVDQAAMRGLINNVYSIFFQKAKAGYRDALALDIASPQPDSYDLDAETVAAKYAELPAD